MTPITAVVSTVELKPKAAPWTKRTASSVSRLPAGKYRNAQSIYTARLVKSSLLRPIASMYFPAKRRETSAPMTNMPAESPASPSATPNRPMVYSAMVVISR